MVSPSYSDTALQYCVDDLSGASISSSRLGKILDCLRLGKPVTRLSLDFLQQQGLEALHRLATGALHYDRFRELALAERCVRIEATTAVRLAREAEERAREAAMQDQQLRARYGVKTYIEKHCFERLMKILKSVDADQRLSPEDFVWLSSVGKQYFSDKLRKAYHRLEADFFARGFRKTRDPWKAVNASSHYRKCDRALDADTLIRTIRVEQQKTPKLKSALCTTHGGVMRDLGHWDKALRLGEKAHAHRADDYRPCTLLGAIHMETGNYSLGQEWYDKAVERGATVDSVDQDLRNIFFRANPAKRAEMREFLLSEDHVRYAWVRSKATT